MGILKETNTARYIRVVGDEIHLTNDLSLATHFASIKDAFEKHPNLYTCVKARASLIFIPYPCSLKYHYCHLCHQKVFYPCEDTDHCSTYPHPE